MSQDHSNLFVVKTVPPTAAVAAAALLAVAAVTIEHGHAHSGLITAALQPEKLPIQLITSSCVSEADFVNI